jgi:hypothetical protein
MADDRITIRLDPSTRRDLKTHSLLAGENLSETVRRALEFYANLNHSFVEMVEARAKALNLPAAIVLQNTWILRAAELAADREFYGGELPDPFLREFPITDEGILTGTELFAFLRAARLRELERQQEEHKAYTERLLDHTRAEREKGKEEGGEECTRPA